MDPFCNPFDAALAAAGPPAVFTRTADGEWRIAERDPSIPRLGSGQQHGAIVLPVLPGRRTAHARGRRPAGGH